jgi:hypothetical protein
MGEKELAKALLGLGASELSSPPGSHEQTQRVLARDRRRVTLLAAITTVFWLGSAALLYGFMAELLGTYAQIQRAGAQAADPYVAPVYRFLLALAGSLEALIFALLCTVILMFASRRAALRQINASLIEISEKLKRLEQQSGTGR